MFKNIVVAVDGSDHAKIALNIACDLSRTYEGAVHIVHAPFVETVAYATGSGVVEIAPSHDEVMKAGREVMEDAVARCKTMDIAPKTKTVKTGDTKAVILGVVEDTGADLVVMGRRGLGSIGSLILGSTSLRVAHDAPCAVLTVK